MMTIGKVIRKLRIERGITQEKLAVHLNISSQAVSKWETDTVLLDISMILPIARYFRISTDVLFGISEIKGSPYANERDRYLTKYECSHDDDDFYIAKKEYEKVIFKDDVSTEDLMSYAYLLDHNSKTNNRRAIEWYEKALALGENNRDEFYYKARIQLIELLARCGRGHESIDKYERIMEIEKENSESYAALGFAYMKVGNYIKAFNVLKKGLELDGKNINILTFLGDASVHLEKYDKALEYYDKAYEADSSYCSCLYGKAELYEKIGNTEMAIKAWNDVIEWLSREGFIYDGETELLQNRIKKLLKNK